MEPYQDLEDYLPLRGRWLRFFFQAIKVSLGAFLIYYVLAIACGPRSFSRSPKGRIGSAKGQIGNFKTAIELYRVDHGGKAPRRLDDLIYPPSAHRSGDASRWKGPYLQDVTTIPFDPWGNAYRYAVPGPAGEPYEIRSLGEDGREGGTGEAEDVSNLKR